MTTISYSDADSWDDLMYKTMCECGHALYQHGFTVHRSISGKYNELWVSQCVMCTSYRLVTDEKGTVKSDFTCREFKRKSNG